MVILLEERLNLSRGKGGGVGYIVANLTMITSVEKYLKATEFLKTYNSYNSE